MRTYKIRAGVVRARELSDRFAMVKNQSLSQYNLREMKHPQSRQQAYKEFYNRFRTELKEEGVKNPILALSVKDGTHVYYGGTRAWLCQELDLTVPVIIADKVDRWIHLDELSSAQEIRKYCKDEPELIQEKDDWLLFRFPPLEYDPIHLKKQGIDWKQHYNKDKHYKGLFSVGQATTTHHAKGNLRKGEG